LLAKLGWAHGGEGEEISIFQAGEVPPMLNPIFIVATSHLLLGKLGVEDEKVHGLQR